MKIQMGCLMVLIHEFLRVISKKNHSNFQHSKPKQPTLASNHSYDTSDLYFHGFAIGITSQEMPEKLAVVERFLKWLSQTANELS